MKRGGTYLTTAKGDYVLDKNGQKIRIEDSGFEVSTSGQISAGGDTQPYATIGIYTFSNEKALEAVSDGMFAVTDASGAPQAAGEETLVKQNALEGSNVEIASEFTKLIRAQRLFSLSSRALSTADKMDGMINSMR